MITIVVAARDREERALEPEYQAIMRLCRRPISLAEISARLDIPLTVVRVLLGDLVAAGDVRTRASAPVTRLPEKKVLQAVLDGIRRL
jgi:predicted ArsR family transcriptional regulator